MSFPKLNGPTGVTPAPQTRPETSYQTRASPHSSQAQNSPTYEAPLEEDAPTEPSLSEDQVHDLNSLLTQPGRELCTTVLFPIEKPRTTWELCWHYIIVYCHLLFECLSCLHHCLSSV